MNRRGFLRAALTSAAVGVVAPAALVELLNPTNRVVFGPPRSGWVQGCKLHIIDESSFYYNADTPSFLTNYADPQMLDYLFKMPFIARKPEGETDAELRDRMLGMSVTGVGMPEGARITHVLQGYGRRV